MEDIPQAKGSKKDVSKMTNTSAGNQTDRLKRRQQADLCRYFDALSQPLRFTAHPFFGSPYLIEP
jgi:hypothetical protein